MKGMELVAVDAGEHGNKRGWVSLSGPCGPRVTTQYQMADILDGPGLFAGP